MSWTYPVLHDRQSADDEDVHSKQVELQSPKVLVGTLAHKVFMLSMAVVLPETIVRALYVPHRVSASIPITVTTFLNMMMNSNIY